MSQDSASGRGFVFKMEICYHNRRLSPGAADGSTHIKHFVYGGSLPSATRGGNKKFARN